MKSPVFVLLFAALAVATNIAVVPTFMGSDEVFKTEVSAFDVQNCNSEPVQIDYYAYDYDGNIIIFVHNITVPVGHSYSPVNDYSGLFCDSSDTNFPYEFCVDTYSPGGSVGGPCATVPCWSTTNPTCNPYGYGLFSDHRVISLPNNC